MVGDEGEAHFGRIALDTGIVGSRPRILGTRVRVSDIVDVLVHGATNAGLLADYPYLGAANISAAIA